MSGDYPDHARATKTPVIKSLVELVAGEFEQRIVSLNRQAPTRSDLARALLTNPREPSLPIAGDWRDHLCTVNYEAPGRGFYHLHFLTGLGDWLAHQISDGPRPDLLVAHKLTIEGICVLRAARRHQLPFAVTIQGNTDLKILRARPDLRPVFKDVFHSAGAVFAFSPWALRDVERLLGPRSANTWVLPCPTDLDQPIAPGAGGQGLASVFHLRNHRTKNLAGLAAAQSLRAAARPTAPLTIFGGGDEAAFELCRKVARGAEIHFAGPLDRADLPVRLNAFRGFVLPSRRESFGLVFIEALFAGLPIVYPAGAGVDGYFDGCKFALRVDASSPRSIAEAMDHLEANEAVLKEALAGWQRSEAAQFFTRAHIAGIFGHGLHAAVTGGRRAG